MARVELNVSNLTSILDSMKDADVENSVKIQFRKKLMERLVRRWEKEIPRHLKRNPDVILDLKKINTYNNGTSGHIGFKGSLMNNTPNMLDDIFNDLEVSDYIKYHVATVEMQKILPKHGEYIKSISLVGKHNIEFISHEESNNDKPVDVFTFQYDEDMLGEIDLTKMISEALAIGYKNWLKSKYERVDGPGKLYYCSYRIPTLCKHTAYTELCPIRNSSSWEELVSLGEEDRREYYLGMRLANYVEEEIKNLLLETIDSEYFEKVLRYCEYSIEKVECVKP